MITLTIYHEKDGELEISNLGEQNITDENLDFVMEQLISNFGFDVLKTEKDGKELSEEEVQSILTTYPCNDENYGKFDNLFFPKK